MTEDELSKSAAEDVSEFIQKALYQYEPMLLGSFMIIQGLAIFKSCLSAGEYEEFCKKVYDDRYKVREFFLDDN